MKKKCSMCRQIKDIKDFHKNSKTKDGYSVHCKECRKKYKSKPRDSFLVVTKKICYVCGENKQINEFYNDKRRKDGRRNICKECENKKREEYFNKNKHTVKEKVCIKCGLLKPIAMFHKCADRYDGHREVCKDCRCKFPVGHHDKVRTEIIKSGKKRCTGCKEVQPLSQFYQRKDGRLGYTSICKSCWALKYADYYKNNYEKIIEIGQKRLALERGLESTFMKEEWFQCLAYFEYTCAYCGKHSNKLQQDHFIPVSKHGGYVRSNIIPACPRCNQSKSNKDFEEWYRVQKFYSQQQEDKIIRYLNQCKEGVADGIAK